MMDVAAPLRNASFVPPIVLVLAYGYAAQAWPQHFQAITLVIYTSLVVVMAVISIVAYRRIRVLDVPAFYVQRLVASQVLYIAALVFICVYLGVVYGSPK